MNEWMSERTNERTNLRCLLSNNPVINCECRLGELVRSVFVCLLQNDVMAVFFYTSQRWYHLLRLEHHTIQFKHVNTLDLDLNLDFLLQIRFDSHFSPTMNLNRNRKWFKFYSVTAERLISICELWNPWAKMKKTLSTIVVLEYGTKQYCSLMCVCVKYSRRIPLYEHFMHWIVWNSKFLDKICWK